MNLLTRTAIPPPTSADQVFRMSTWGAWFAHLLFLAGAVAPLGLFVALLLAPEIEGFHWSHVVLPLFALMMWGLSRITGQVLSALRAPGNWLVRVGPGGMLVKIRSYLHEDSPDEDPIAMRLPWSAVRCVRLHKETLQRRSMGETEHVQRHFLTITLNPAQLDVEKVKAALAFEHQRKPAHAKVDESKRALFLARKQRAPEAEIAQLKDRIANEQREHPGGSKGRFLHRQVSFLEPDQLQMDWSHATPGRKKLREYLARYTTFEIDAPTERNIDKPMTESEFEATLALLVRRDAVMEAVELIRNRAGCSLAEAKVRIEEVRRTLDAPGRLT